MWRWTAQLICVGEKPSRVNCYYYEHAVPLPRPEQHRLWTWVIKDDQFDTCERRAPKNRYPKPGEEKS